MMTEPNNSNLSPATLAKIEHFLKLGYMREDLVILPDGDVIVFYQDELKGVVEHLSDEQKD